MDNDNANIEKIRAQKERKAISQKLWVEKNRDKYNLYYREYTKKKRDAKILKRFEEILKEKNMKIIKV